MKTNYPNSSCKRNAVIITAFLIALSMSSLVYLLLPTENGTGYVADIYQNGTLIMSIPLSEREGNRTFTIEGANGCINEVEIRAGSIGVIAADCPDKLCVHQGFVSDSKLPITCLPNRLIIQLRPLQDSGDTAGTPDGVTY